MHEFKKVEFAQMVKKNILSDEDISAEIREIIDEIKISKLKNLKKYVVKKGFSTLYI